MRIIAKSTLRKFWEQAAYSDARGPLESWHEEAVKAAWTSPHAVKSAYRKVSICGNNRVVFNIGGNKYRLVVEMQYRSTGRALPGSSSSARMRDTTKLTWRP